MGVGSEIWTAVKQLIPARPGMCIAVYIAEHSTKRMMAKAIHAATYQGFKVKLKMYGRDLHIEKRG